MLRLSNHPRTMPPACLHRTCNRMAYGRQTLYPPCGRSPITVSSIHAWCGFHTLCLSAITAKTKLEKFTIEILHFIASSDLRSRSNMLPELQPMHTADIFRYVHEVFGRTIHRDYRFHAPHASCVVRCPVCLDASFSGASLARPPIRALLTSHTCDNTTLWCIRS